MIHYVMNECSLWWHFGIWCMWQNARNYTKLFMISVFSPHPKCENCCHFSGEKFLKFDATWFGSLFNNISAGVIDFVSEIKYLKWLMVASSLLMKVYWSRQSEKWKIKNNESMDWVIPGDSGSSRHSLKSAIQDQLSKNQKDWNN